MAKKKKVTEELLEELDNTIDTIEGNTSATNINDGEFVARKKRTSVIGKSIGGDLAVRGFIRKLNV